MEIREVIRNAGVVIIIIKHLKYVIPWQMWHVIDSTQESAFII